MSDTLERIQRAIDFVEAHLFEDLPLTAIAARADASPWHFHRTFSAVTGETPATYVWKRRLSEICRRLVETREPLVEVALDCGFESQATFTRAFTRYVGVAPGRFRRTQPHLLPAYRYPPLDLAALAERQRRMEFMEPRIVRKPAFIVVGMADRFTPTSPRIPELWGRFAPRIHEVPHRRGLHTLGVCIGAEPATVEEAGFTYLAGVEVERAGDVPEGMIVVTVPENAYAVLTHTGHLSRLPDTVKHVWGRWLPASPYRHVPAPDFEYYDPARWDPGTGEGEVDLYVPIADA
ncbi:MAG TPA: AraC family transcriptional regulator [Candidatus Eisenbacteria bacterium]|nr:AraC family transcriptional regulator [Candidatus Eisenbacteria bacterium]